MFLVALFYFCTREIFYTSTVLSMVVSVAAALVVALRLAPSASLALLGTVLRSQGYYPAEQVYREALRLRPDDPLLPQALAELQQKQGKTN